MVAFSNTFEFQAGFQSDSLADCAAITFSENTMRGPIPEIRIEAQRLLESDLTELGEWERIGEESLSNEQIDVVADYLRRTGQASE